MAKKILKRLLFAVITFFVLTFFVFALSNMMKGNAVDARTAAANPRMSQETSGALVLRERELMSRFLCAIGIGFQIFFKEIWEPVSSSICL